MTQRNLIQQSLASLQNPIEPVYEEPEIVDPFPDSDPIVFPDSDDLNQMVAQEFTAMGLSHQTDENDEEGEE